MITLAVFLILVDGIAYFVEIESDKGARLAYGQDLAQAADRLMAVLTCRGNRIKRQDRWPTKKDYGSESPKHWQAHYWPKATPRLMAKLVNKKNGKQNIKEIIYAGHRKQSEIGSLIG